MEITRNKGKSMIATFKGITVSKDGFHKVKYQIDEKKSEASIKSSITLILEDTDMIPSDSLEDIIAKGAEIAIKEYVKRQGILIFKYQEKYEYRRKQGR